MKKPKKQLISSKEELPLLRETYPIIWFGCGGTTLVVCRGQE